MELHHHSYLISHLHLRDQQGQFSALSTLHLFQWAENTTSGQVSQGTPAAKTAEKKKTEEDNDRMAKKKDKGQMKMLNKNSVHKNVGEFGTGL